jgi:KAT8 regulatory NSL complex subunit 2
MATHVLLKGRPAVVRPGKSADDTGLCNYSGHLCLLNQLEGYKFCIRHILEDINAPYRQCSFVFSKKGKRCPNAAPKIENKESYCSDHTKKILMARQRALRKRRPAESLESLLDQLIQSGEENKKPQSDHKSESKDKKPCSISKVLDCASDSESDCEQPMIDQMWRTDVDSDADSLDSDVEDPLRHAGVYTAEETALITRDKMVRLQSLYIQELKRLNHVLRERRRVYLHSIRHEKESLGSIHATPRTSPDEERQYQKLKAMIRYHTRHGPDLLLYKRHFMSTILQNVSFPPLQNVHGFRWFMDEMKHILQ